MRLSIAWPAFALALPLAAAESVPHAHHAPRVAREHDHAGPSVAPVSRALDVDARELDAWRATGRARARQERRGLAPRRQRERRDGVAARPELLVGRGVELAVHPHVSRASGLERRNGQGNGTIMPLAESVGTYIVPVTIGNPASVYPLQLDLGSTDLLLASALCGSACPSPSADYPFYAYSTSFEAVNDNHTAWSATFADGSVASGFIARDTVRIGAAGVDGQAFGLINATNLTLSAQEISGIFGLGFPRQSLLARILLKDAAEAANATAKGNDTVGASSAATSVLSTSASAASASGSAAASSSASSASTSSAAAAPTYLPPFLESLVRTPHIPYPVFALALAPPPDDGTATASSSAPSSTLAARYSAQTGSLTFGGVSGAYISNVTGTGRTVADIEWWDVVPFGPSISNSSNATSANRYGGVDETAAGGSTAAASSTSSIASVPASSAPASSVAASSASASASSGARRRDVASELDAMPTSVAELDSEFYLYWALELANVSMNGTDVGLTSSYAADGVRPIALLDAGTNGIYAPQQDVERLFALVTDAREVAEGVWAVPCDADMAMGFSFGGRYIQLEPSDWMYAAVAGSSFCLAWPQAIADDGTGIGWHLGTPFLRNVYTVFSYGINGAQSPLVGFLPLANTTNTTALLSPTPTLVPAAAPTLSATVATTLPNYLLPSPSYATPSYALSLPAPSTGAVQYMGLANASAYSVADVPVVGTASVAVSVTTSGGGGATTEDHAASAAGRTARAALAAVGIGAAAAVLAC